MFSKLLSRHTSGGPGARPPGPSPFSHWFTRFAERLAGLHGWFWGRSALQQGPCRHWDLVLLSASGMRSRDLDQNPLISLAAVGITSCSAPGGHPASTLRPRAAAQSQAAEENCCPAPWQLILCSSRCPSKCQGARSRPELTFLEHVSSCPEPPGTAHCLSLWGP